MLKVKTLSGIKKTVLMNTVSLKEFAPNYWQFNINIFHQNKIPQNLQCGQNVYFNEHFLVKN